MEVLSGSPVPRDKIAGKGVILLKPCIIEAPCNRRSPIRALHAHDRCFAEGRPIMIATIIGKAIQYRWWVLILVAIAAGFGVYSFRQLPIDAYPDIRPSRCLSPRPTRWRKT